MSNRVGQQLGNYRLIRLLGQGGCAEVYLGEHIHLKSLAAVKVLHNQLEGQSKQDFVKEAQTIAALKHPHILRVLDFSFDGDLPFLVMEYAPHGTLRMRHPHGSIVPLSDVVAYVKQIAAALQYAHQHKLIHRDVKPENMLIDEAGNLLLSDFGIATVAHSTASLKEIDRSGTPHYMAPEQFEGKPCPASDQYALAVTVYEWLCGQRLFRGDSFVTIGMLHLTAPVPSLRETNPAIPPHIEQVISVALSKDPQQRFATIQAFATALEHAYRESTHSPMNDKMLEAASLPSSIVRRPATRDKKFAIMASVSLFLVLCLGLTTLMLSGGMKYILPGSALSGGRASAAIVVAPHKPALPTNSTPQSTVPLHRTVVDNLDNWSKTYSHSESLKFDTTNRQFMGGDTSLVARTINSREEITWFLQHMTSFQAITYFWPSEPVSPFSLYTSADGTHWTARVPVITGGAGNWPCYRYRLNNLSHVNYVKLRWNNTRGHWWSPQVGQVTMTS